ncbi:MAG: hypothetical protein NUW01_13585 [Gemmatimonadaceae bacterium]|nr:hypothetical protein [Gemmatimonadaceae bacterium]
MAAFNIKSTLLAIQSYLAASGHVKLARIGEPKSPPESVTAAVYMSSVAVAELTLATTIESQVVTIRLYRGAFDDAEAAELELAQVVSNISRDLLGEFDLGGTIRNVDAGGQYGTGLSARWGYVDVGGTMYRVADMTVPLVVDDSASLAP